MKSHPILEAIAVFVSLAASACISIDDHDDKPKTTTVTKETVPPYPLTNPSVITTETTTTRSR
jgi:hypothetical protein